MTKLRLLALLAVVALVLFPAIAFAAGPAWPCGFHGTVQQNGQNVPDGTTITITVGNGSYSTTTTTEAGVSRYGILITPAGETGYTDGTAVTFKIAGTTVGQSTWATGENVEVNLSSGTPTPGGCACITVAQLGNTTGVSNGVLTIDQNQIKGAAGATGAAGAPGAAGADGKSANNVLGIVGIVLAAIALILVVVVMMRKPQAAPPSPKT